MAALNIAACPLGFPWKHVQSCRAPSTWFFIFKVFSLFIDPENYRDPSTYFFSILATPELPRVPSACRDVVEYHHQLRHRLGAQERGRRPGIEGKGVPGSKRRVSSCRTRSLQENRWVLFGSLLFDLLIFFIVITIIIGIIIFIATIIIICFLADDVLEHVGITHTHLESSR